MAEYDPAIPGPASVEADPKKPYKAYAAFLVTLLGTLWAALEGKDDLSNMTLMEWLTIIVPTLLTTAAVYGIRNPKIVD